MGRPATPLLGKRVGCYTVAERVFVQQPHTYSKHAHWRVVCDCGFSKVVSSQNLVRFFPMKCNHVPEGHRVIGPNQAAVMKAIDDLDGESVCQLELSEWRPLVALAKALVALRDAETDAAYARRATGAEP